MVFSPIFTLALAVVGKIIVFNCVFSADIREMVFAGTVLGYVGYEVGHYYIHHSKSHFFESLKAYHRHHHYRSPFLGFGVSSKLWDIVFDTEISLFKQKSKAKAVE